MFVLQEDSIDIFAGENLDDTVTLIIGSVRKAEAIEQFTVVIKIFKIHVPLICHFCKQHINDSEKLVRPCKCVSHFPVKQTNKQTYISFS